jgi:hypothetical protein
MYSYSTPHSYKGPIFRIKALITPEYWNRCDDHVFIKIERGLWEVDGIQEEEVAPLIISFSNDDDSDDDQTDKLEETDDEKIYMTDEYDLPDGKDEKELDVNDNDTCIYAKCAVSDDNDFGSVLCIECDARERWYH